MAESDFRIFVSAVTSEFGKARDALAADLRARNAYVRVQSDFRQESEADTTLRKLHDYICDCSAVVAVIGRRSGAIPSPAAAAPFTHMLPAGIVTASYTQWEFFFSRYYKRRLSIYIANDDYMPNEPAPSADEDLQLQQAFIAHIEAEDFDRDYFSSEDRLCRLVLREDWPIKKAINIPTVDVDRLPFLADRQPQVWRICRSVAERIKGAMPSAAEPRRLAPALFILPSWEEDAVDMFHWRLTDKDGPEYCEFEAKRDNPSWVGQRLSWPPDSTPQSFSTEFIGSNLPYVRSALRISKQRRRPVYFRTLVAVAEIEEHFRGFVDAWIGCWPNLLEQASQSLTPETPQSASSQPVVGLLIFQYKTTRTKLWPFWKPRASRVNRCSGFLQGVEANPTIQVSVLPPLTTVTFQNASEWLELPEVLQHGFDRRARSAILQMFQNRMVGVPMEEFANTLNAVHEQRVSPTARSGRAQ